MAFQVLMHTRVHTDIYSLPSLPCINWRVLLHPHVPSHNNCTSDCQGSHSHAATFAHVSIVMNWTWLSLGDSALALCFWSHWLFFSPSVEIQHTTLCPLQITVCNTIDQEQKNRLKRIATPPSKFKEKSMLGFGALPVLNFQCLHILCFNQPSTFILARDLWISLS